MNIFEKWVGGLKDVSKELEPKKLESQQIVKEDEVRVPKKMEDIKVAVGDIQELTSKRWDTLQKHRDTVEELRRYGVNEYNPDTSPRTETVKDILNPIEDELVAISQEITDKREDFDLQPNREEVIKGRQFRLGELKHRAQKQFESTPSGKNIAYIDAKIAAYFQQSDLYRKEIADLRDKQVEFFNNDKVAHTYVTIIERIEHLSAQLTDMLTKSKRYDYDNNGLNSI